MIAHDTIPRELLDSSRAVLWNLRRGARPPETHQGAVPGAPPRDQGSGRRCGDLGRDAGGDLGRGRWQGGWRRNCPG